jgi:glycosyltransferase involved in cell wall biosynthesis
LRPGSEPRRVVHATSQRGWRGGEQQLLWLHGRLAALGVEQRIVCPKGSELARRAAEHGADVVEAAGRGVDPRFAGALARASRGADLVHAHDAGAHAAAVIASALLRTPWAVVVSRKVVFPIGRGPLTRWKYDHRSVRRIVCSSGAIADVLRDAVRDPGGRLRVVHDAVDADRFAAGRGTGQLRRELGVPDGVALVGTVAAVAEEKDPFTFVDVAARLLGEGRALRFAWVGEGPLRPAAEARCRELGVADRVSFTGFRSDVTDLLPGLDLFLFTSRSEGLGTSLLDAQACSVPVVATTAGGIPEAVLDGKTGLLARPGEVSALAERAARVLDDPGLRARLVQAASQRVRHDFGLDELARGTLAVYREAIAPPPPVRE